MLIIENDKVDKDTPFPRVIEHEGGLKTFETHVGGQIYSFNFYGVVPECVKALAESVDKALHTVQRRAEEGGPALKQALPVAPVYCPIIYVAGQPVRVGYFQTKPTAERLSPINSIQEVAVVDIDGRTFVPIEVTPATKTDLRKQDALDKLRRAGLTDSDIKAVQ